VTYFKPFKNAFKKKRNATMAKNNFFEPNKVIMTKSMDKALQQSLKKKNIKFRFKVCGICQ
jgi:translation initiation factor 2B subunit (eIF-2B alpha/beta/delta family)